MLFTFLENPLNLGIFVYVSPNLKIARKFWSSHPRQKEITLFHPTAERGGGNYGLLYQNSIGKNEDGLEH